MIMPTAPRKFNYYRDRGNLPVTELRESKPSSMKKLGELNFKIKYCNIQFKH